MPLKLAYDNVSFIYDFLNTIYFRNICRRSSMFFFDSLSKHVNDVLFPGCGTGLSVADFLRINNPKSCTVNDIAERMLAKTQKKISDTGWNGNFVVNTSDILAMPEEKKYDLISVNYFLNMFNYEKRLVFLKKLDSLLSEDGVLLIADFNRPKNTLILFLAQINWLILSLFFFISAQNKLNKLGNIQKEIETAGFKIKKHKNFIAGAFSSFYCTR